MAKNDLSKIEREAQEWGGKLEALSNQLALLQSELITKQENTATAILDGGDLAGLSADLATLEKKGCYTGKRGKRCKVTP